MTKATNSAIALSLLIALSGCGPQGTVVRADDYDAETIVDLMNEEEPIVEAEAAIPHKQLQQSQHKSDKAHHTPLSGEWYIIQAEGNVINRDIDMPYIIFSDKDGRFYASNGCNILNGDFSFGNDGKLTFGNVVTSMKECPDVPLQENISAVIRDGNTVKTKIEDKNRETHLYIYSSNNDLLLELRKHNLEVINGQWEVAFIGDEEVDGSEINVFFDIPERAIHGNTGCNYFNGAIIIDPNLESSISFSQMGVTMRMCENAELERQMLVGLEETATYELDGNKLKLNDDNGNTLIVLRKANK